MNRQLAAAMEVLSRERPVFHSEADFQHALAWQLHKQRPEGLVRLEYLLSVALDTDRRQGHYDVVLLEDGHMVVVELKYKKAPFLGTVAGEFYFLKGDGAQDQGRYDFPKDVTRLEEVVSRGKSAGYAILLTNDSLYGQLPISSTTTTTAVITRHSVT